MAAETRTVGTITYTLTRKNVKNINMRVRSDGTVSVSAPAHVPVSVIDDFVLSKADFIKNSISRLLSVLKEEAKKYQSGDKLPFLGGEITLSVLQGDTGVSLEGDTLCVSCINTHNDAIRKKLVRTFLDNECQTLFKSLIDKYYGEFASFGIGYPQMKIKQMKSRWGSCTPSKGIITLNSRLIAVPLECIEYVVVHEYCHFLEANHSKRFYAHVARYIPDWKERRALLADYTNRAMNGL